MSRIVGRGWATIDLDRAATQLAHLLDRGEAFADAPRSEALGARCRRGRARRDTDVEAEWIVLLEPDTEGRLAAFLARVGEGWAATWTAAGAVGVAGVADQADPGRPGPLGPERLSGGAPMGRPYPLILTTATIDR